VDFVLLYVIVAKVGLPRVRSILAKRQAQIQAVFTEATHLKQTSDTALGAYRDTLMLAHKQADTFLDETRRKLEADRKEAAETLKEDLDDRIRDAEQSVIAASTAELTHLRDMAGEAAAAIVTKLTGLTPAEKDVAAALRRALQH
jgi:F-type H+-transporting ATPase subunit b